MRMFQGWHIRSKLLHKVSLAHEDARGSLFPDALIKESVIEKWKNGNLTLGILNPLSWTVFPRFAYNSHCFLSELIVNESKHSGKDGKALFALLSSSFTVSVVALSSEQFDTNLIKALFIAKLPPMTRQTRSRRDSSTESFVSSQENLELLPKVPISKSTQPGRRSSRLGKLSFVAGKELPEKEENVTLKLRRLGLFG